MIGLMVLHWGTVDLTIKVSGLDPSCSVIKAPVKSGVIGPLRGSGNTKCRSGSGGNG